MSRFPESLIDAATAMRRGELSSSTLVELCLERVARFEPQLAAWVMVDHEGARRAARQADREQASGVDRGLLHGIPLGVKDLVDVEGWPTLAGSPLRAGHRASGDAPVIAQLRAAGAVLLGKTVTTEWAWIDPAETRNPWNDACTPGGSSSGSAAAVAAGMCLAAVGSQTGGSITRPATYCGVCGWKPAWGEVSALGVVPVSSRLDHVGALARRVGDLQVMASVMIGRGAVGADSLPAASVPEKNPSECAERATPPRLGWLGEFFFDEAETTVRELTHAARERLSAAGAMIEDLPLPESFKRAHAAHRAIMAYEAARAHAATFPARATEYAPEIRALLAEGFAIADEDFRAACQLQGEFGEAIRVAGQSFDALVAPATPTTAPRRRDTTGDPRFNSPWSLAGMATVSIPCGVDGDGMPGGLQLIGTRGSDNRLFDAAGWCQGVLGSFGWPPGFEPG